MPDFTDNHKLLWREAVREQYGCAIEADQFYLEQTSLRVYAGSEYIAQVVSDDDLEPDNATEWANSISHFPRDLRTLVTSERRV